MADRVRRAKPSAPGSVRPPGAVRSTRPPGRDRTRATAPRGTRSPACLPPSSRAARGSAPCPPAPRRTGGSARGVSRGRAPPPAPRRAPRGRAPAAPAVSSGAISSGLRREHVPLAPPRLDQRGHPGDVDPLAQGADRRVDGVAHDLRAVVVDVLLDLGTRDDLALAR